MNRHVIKGRGPNRGKYLGYEHANGGSGYGYVWVPRQKNAATWDDPRYSGSTYVTALASEHNGYFVKVVASRAIVQRVDELRAFIRSHASGAEAKLACYWVGGANETFPEPLGFDPSCNFCRDCCETKIAEIHARFPERAEDVEVRLDGGFDTDHDSPPYCETCGARLSGSLTECGADDEIEALTDDCAPTFDNAYGWDELDDALVNVSDDDPRWRAVARVVDDAAAAEREHEAVMAALAASPGMGEARASFLSLLAVRKVQKAPEPSFRLWNELLAWFPTRGEGDKNERAKVERPLIVEAKRFAAALGFRAYWSGGMFMIADHYWPFVVQREQYRLWRPKPYQEGEAYGGRRRSKYRDGNPYPEGSVEASQWDCGYMNAIEGPRREKAAA